MTREKAIEILESGSWSGYDDEEISEAVEIGAEALKEQRPHGEWKEMWHSGKDVYSCTECFEAYKMPILYNFCPNCGADMRKEEGDK